MNIAYLTISTGTKRKEKKALNAITIGPKNHVSLFVDYD